MKLPNHDLQKLRRSLSKPVFSIIGILLLISSWKFASYTMSGLVVASPEATLYALYNILSREDFLSSHFLVSVQRLFLGISLGTTGGFVLGVLAGLNTPLRQMLEPFRWVLMSVPAVVVIVVAMLWFGMGSAMVVFITSLLLSPVIYVSTVEGMHSVDRDLVEMSEIYRFSLIMKFRHIYLMYLVPPLASGMAIVVGNGVRIVILAEVLGANQGLGYMLSSARTNLEIAELYALVLLSLLIVGITDLCLLKPILKRITRWRVSSND